MSRDRPTAKPPTGEYEAAGDLAFDYSDYHRTIIGFHGTTAEAAERLVAGEPFEASDQDDEWFGKGVYFWEHAPKQAWWWAEKHKEFGRPAVVWAMIRLGNCFDLLDPVNVAVLKRMKELLEGNLASSKNPISKNVRSHKNLDCAVFNYLYGRAEAAGTPIESARAAFVPVSAKKRLWRG